MTDIKELMEKAVKAYHSGTAHRWEFAECAEQIVGRYERGVTLELAAVLGISVSQVENLARAGLVWREALATYPDQVKQLNNMRAVLPISHWVTLGDMWKRLEFELHDGLSLLEEVAMAEKIITVAEWRNLLLGHFADGGGLTEWEERYQSAKAKIGKMVNDYGCPENVRAAGMDFLAAGSGNDHRLFTIAGDWPYSMNDITNKKNSYAVRDLVREIKAMIRGVIDPEDCKVDVPCDVYLTAYFSGRVFDSGNIPQKPMIDALTGWAWPDDRPEYVRRVVMTCRKDKKNPRLEILCVPLPGAKPWDTSDVKAGVQDEEV